MMRKLLSVNKKFLLIQFFIVFTSAANAQGFTVFGYLNDNETGTAIPGATVQLRSLKDATISFTSYTDTSGLFQFDNIRPDSFRIIYTSVGFETLTRGVRVDTANVNLGRVTVPRTSAELRGVTVTGRVPPAQQRGDTVQFNASQFKVNPDASAEDLARKIPGITIENGEVKAQGENVRRVTIDGRELFGDDATAALRNLPAEVIDKIQVFDRLSDQSQFTGFDDGNTTKEINIITKANMRNGQFGRLYVGYGTDNRYQAGGNATFLKENRRISFVGNFNNINQQNFSQQDLLGATSNVGRGGRGGGGPRGGGGGRGGGGFGSNNNFMVGQQNGINRTNALGINYADKWGAKATVSGSYLFNNSNNTNNEIANTQYFNERLPDFHQATNADSRNYNHRVNMRIEYRIDSANQIIITPNLSFQSNVADRIVATTFMNNSFQPLNATINETNNDRSGNNLNNTILYRHSFPKRGRTFSVNLNTSYNKRAGDTFIETIDREYTSAGFEDTETNRFTDQFNNSFQVSTNFVYTEPIGEKSQLQFNYNPSFSKSTADQRAFGYNDMTDKYSINLDSLSNVFENTFNAHNAGLAYRNGDRDNMFSVGVNFQHSNLESDQSFPRTLSVNQSFTNILPNAMLRRKLSATSNIRLFYRANTNAPSVTQLQGVPDPTNAPFFSVGNPELEQQYMHIVSSRYTYTNTAKGILIMANVFWQTANNYITNATFVPLKDSAIGYDIFLRPGQQLNKPVNLDGFNSLRSFFTFAVPLRFIKSNLNLNGGFTYSQLPGLLNQERNETKNQTYTMGSVISSNISEFVDFTVSYSANFNTVSSDLKTREEDKYFSHAASVQLNLLSKTGWFFQNDLSNRMFTGLAQGFNQNYTLWNMGVGKKIFKDRKGELRLNVFDLLKQNRSITRNVNENYIEDVQNEVLRQYFMMTFTYNLRNFGAPIPAPRGSGRR